MLHGINLTVLHKYCAFFQHLSTILISNLGQTYDSLSPSCIIKCTGNTFKYIQRLLIIICIIYLFFGLAPGILEAFAPCNISHFHQTGSPVSQFKRKHLNPAHDPSYFH